MKNRNTLYIILSIIIIILLLVISIIFISLYIDKTKEYNNYQKNVNLVLESHKEVRVIELDVIKNQNNMILEEIKTGNKQDAENINNYIILTKALSYIIELIKTGNTDLNEKYEDILEELNISLEKYFGGNND